MLILGLGTNLGDGLSNLRSALRLLQKSSTMTPLQISPIYTSAALLPAYAPMAWNRPYLNIAVACDTKLSPFDALSQIKQIEKQLGREENQRWAPRVIDVDILAWDDLIIDQADLKIPHAELLTRPFALWPLLDVWPNWTHPGVELSSLLHSWGSRFTGEQAALGTQQIAQRLNGSALVGILNITADSFSDGGQFISIPNATAQAEKLVREGAEVLDIGAESTRPGASAVFPVDEWRQLAPVLTAIKERWKQWPFKPKLSVDTRHPWVAARALEHGIDWINDVSGFADEKMRRLAAEYAVKCVLMHNLGIPVQKNRVLATHLPICEQILTWAELRFNQLLDAGVAPEQLIFDIGIGFGKTAQQSQFLLQNMKRFRPLNCPLLVGHSRKSFLDLMTDKPFAERDFETAMISYQLALQGVEYLRVHNVGLNRQAVAMATEIISSDARVMA